MRRLTTLVTAAVCGVVAAGAARAADPAGTWMPTPVLRGSNVEKYGDGSAPPRYVPGYPSYFRWEGFYVGAQLSRSSTNMDFGTGTKSLIDFILREDVVQSYVADWTTLSKVDTNLISYGGFVGYNLQWEQAIVGVELNYNGVSSGGRGSSMDSLTRSFNDDTGAPAQHHYFYTATVSSSASARITSYGSLRVRAGYGMDRFMPYMFAGLAVGTVDVSRSATVTYLRRDIPDVTDPPIAPQPNFIMGPVTRTDEKKNAVAYGFAAGLGIDIALLPNLFVRGEWEYVQFAPLKDIKINVNTLRAGVALKF